MSSIPRSTMAAIDSLSLYLPLHEIEVLDKRLTARTATIDLETGDLSNPRKGSNIQVYMTGYSVHFKRVRTSIEGFNQAADYVAVSVSSKLLEGNYFAGITLETISQVMSLIDSFGVIKVSPDVFLAARVRDVDIRLDCDPQHFGCQDFQQVIGFHKKALATRYEAIGRAYQAKSNQGFEVSSRKGATQRHPYIKIYNKAVELEHNSATFFDSHLAGKKPSSIVRIEATLKNTGMMRHFGLLQRGEQPTLATLLTKTEDELMKVINNVHGHYFNPEFSVPVLRDSIKEAEKKVQKLTSRMFALIDVFFKAYPDGDILDYQELVESVFQPTKNERVLHKKLAEVVFIEYTDEQEKRAQSQTLDPNPDTPSMALFWRNVHLEIKASEDARATKVQRQKYLEHLMKQKPQGDHTDAIS